MPNYEVKGLKQHRGHGGEPLFQGTMYCDGKKVGFIGDGDWGGEQDVDFLGNKEAEAACREWSKTQPSDWDNMDKTYTMTRAKDIEAKSGKAKAQAYLDNDRYGYVMIEFLDKAVKLKDAKSMKKKQRPVMFVVKGTVGIRQASVPNTDTPQVVRDYFQKKYGDDITFLSDMPVEAIVELLG